MTAEALSKVIVKGMEDKKASDIVIMDLRGVKNSMTDFFVVCSGNSDTQVEAIADAIEDEVIKTNKEKNTSFYTIALADSVKTNIFAENFI